MNLAQMLGPVVSGVLIEVGGFQLPFLVMGSLQVCMTLLCCLLPPDDEPGECVCMYVCGWVVVFAWVRVLGDGSINV